MAKLDEAFATPMAFRSFDPVKFGGSSRLTFKRLRQPTRLPAIGSATVFGRYLQRLGAMFSKR